MEAYAVISSDLKTVNNSLNSGQSLITFKPRSVIAKDIVNFANKLILEREGSLENSKIQAGKRKKK